MQVSPDEMPCSRGGNAVHVAAGVKVAVTWTVRVTEGVGVAVSSGAAELPKPVRRAAANAKPAEISEKMVSSIRARGMEIVISVRRRRMPVLACEPISVPHTMQRVAVLLRRVPQRGHTPPAVDLAFAFALIRCPDTGPTIGSDYTSYGLLGQRV